MNDEIKMNELWQNLLHHNVLIVWSPDYELGIPIVDEQHRGIVSTINSLYYGMQNKQGEDLLRPVISMINNYTRTHFEIEEDFLQKCKFPGLKGHQGLHNELVKKLAKFETDSLLHKDPLEFLDFLKEWWIDHICVKDKVFLEYLLKTSPDQVTANK
jgi:hemerythrin-like metal-binding protein